MNTTALLRRVATLALLMLPGAAEAAPITFNLLGDVYSPSPSIESPVGSIGGTIDYDADTGIFSAARILVSLAGFNLPYELTVIEPVAKDDPKAPKPPIVIKEDPPIDGESSDKGHRVDLPLRSLPDPTRPSVDFSGVFYSASAPTVQYGLRGTASVAVPEPSSLALLALGVLGLAGLRRTRREAA